MVRRLIAWTRVTKVARVGTCAAYIRLKAIHHDGTEFPQAISIILDYHIR